MRLYCICNPTFWQEILKMQKPVLRPPDWDCIRKMSVNRKCPFVRPRLSINDTFSKSQSFKCYKIKTIFSLLENLDVLYMKSCSRSPCRGLFNIGSKFYETLASICYYLYIGSYMNQLITTSIWYIPFKRFNPWSPSGFP